MKKGKMIDRLVFHKLIKEDVLKMIKEIDWTDESTDTNKIL